LTDESDFLIAAEDALSPLPERFGCLVCIRTTSGNGTFSA
jgi:hypothetical protein